MKRMELTSFYLKLNELKEYEQAKQERQDASNNKTNTAAATSDKPNNVYSFKWPKTDKEIRERIGLNIADNQS